MTQPQPPETDVDVPARPLAHPAPRERTAATNTRIFYRDYLLSCQPLRLDSGGFQPRVVVTSMAGDKTRSQRFVDLDESVATEDAAIERARRAGMEWVDVNDRVW